MSEVTAPTTGAEDVAWQLEDLYAGVDDPKIETDLQRAADLAEQLAADYKGRIAALDAKEMRDMLDRYEDILEIAHILGAYAQMNWSTATTDAPRGALMQMISERSSQLQQQLVFLDLEWANAPDEHAAALMADPVLEPYLHYLEIARLQKPYLLTEPEEKILAEKSVTGRSAWSRYFDELHSAAKFMWDDEEIARELALNKLFMPDRDERIKAQEVVTEGLQNLVRSSTFVFNTILADKASNDRLRGYPTWVSSRNMSNEVDDDSVEALINAVSGRYDIVARYYKLKGKLLGLDQLYDYDRYAPLPAADRQYSWADAQALVLESFSQFHPQMAEIAGKFFDERWIDAPIRPGKRGGAYAMPMTPSTHPYVLLNYDGTPRNVMTLAHELGHGIHQYLYRHQGMLHGRTPLTTAETASVFGEMLTFHEMLRREDSDSVRLAMLTNKIEDSFATVFRQISMNRFEHSIHTARREQGELSTEQFSELWMETQRDMFKDSVTMTDNYAIWWSYIPHFIGVPGYVYAYAFGELLVLALYARYEEVGPDFATDYITMLSQGSSDWPHEIVKPLGVDLTDPDFWQQGLQILDNMVSDAEKLAEELG